MDVQERRNLAFRFLRLGARAQRRGDLERAVRFYRRSLAVYPTPEGHTHLGWAYSEQGRLEEAIAECMKAIALDPDYGNAYNDIGAYLMEQGRLDDAVPWLEQATRARRYDTPYYPWMNLGRLWEHKGEWHRALDCYKKALEQAPRFPPAVEAVARLRGLMN